VDDLSAEEESSEEEPAPVPTKPAKAAVPAKEEPAKAVVSSKGDADSSSDEEDDVAQ
jgi:hypothetical protein